MKDIFDIIIIGGGPSGLYSAFYAGLRELRVKIIEYQAFLGGKLNVYPEKIVWDVGGIPATPAQILIENLIKQGLTFNPEVYLNTKVDLISIENNIYHVHTHNGQTHYSKKVIVAVGGGIISPIKLELEGAEKYEVSNLHYTIKGMQRFNDKSVLISGGGNSAVDWAFDLVDIAKEITVIYRGDTLTAHEAQIRRLKEHGVQIITNTQIKTLVSNQEKSRIEAVMLEHLHTKKTSQFRIDEVLINHGYDRDQSFMFEEHIAPERDSQKHYFIMTNAKGLSSVDGIYAVGDIARHDSKINLIAGAFQDAINAVNDIKLKLDPEADKIAIVSSHNAVFKQRNRDIINNLITK